MKTEGWILDTCPRMPECTIGQFTNKGYKEIIA